MTCLYYTDNAIDQRHLAGAGPAAAKASLDIVALAREVGMLITLDARIGNQEYRSVSGSLSAFERFAQAVCEAAAA
ncbi:hypothetical protein [Trinickia terrae]|uniref:hypothetical protein n=1 Tax=Trinickia terrae TaxID=2571161 RepID=UPI00146C3FF6|nr:hypothetical protein [Trinickia terrae]